MELGYIHPDVMMQCMTSRQFFSWYTYATLEQVGNPVYIERPEDKVKKQREQFEAGMQRMMTQRR